jgi:YggT family protein
MDIIIVPLLLLIKSIICFASCIIIADVLLSWLITARVFNTENYLVHTIVSCISRFSNYMLDPIRKRMPNNIGLDISPVILLLLLTFFDNIIKRILMRAF